MSGTNVQAAGKEYCPVVSNYTVRKGDNLSIISKATGISVFNLANDNKLKDPNKLSIGQNLTLKYHLTKEDTINNPELSDEFPTIAEQVDYFERKDMNTLSTYKNVEKEGAQEYIKNRKLDTEA